MVDDESGCRPQRVRAEPAKVSVARQDQQVRRGRCRYDLALHPPVPLLPFDLAPDGNGRSVEELAARSRSQVTDAPSWVQA